MATAPPPGKCVHCLRSPVIRTWDHVFPKAWYPDTAVTNVYKWQVPSCYPCNQEYGRLEQDLLLRLGLCIDPKAAETSGILQKVLRSLDPSFAKNEKDRRARQAKRDEIIGKSLTGPQILRARTYPGLGEKWGRPLEQQRAITIEEKSVHRLAEKIVRGIFYLDENKFLEPPDTVSFYAIPEQDAAPLVTFLQQYGTVYAQEPGIVVKRALSAENKTSSLFYIDIWSTFKMFATVDVLTG